MRAPMFKVLACRVLQNLLWPRTKTDHGLRSMLQDLERLAFDADKVVCVVFAFKKRRARRTTALTVRAHTDSDYVRP